MVVCVECGCPVNHVYREFSKGNIRLTRCDNCGCIADKYVEHDALIIFLELILHKEQAHRHVLFNRLPYVDRGLDKKIVQFAIAIIFFDAYTKWFLHKNSFYSERSEVWPPIGCVTPHASDKAIHHLDALSESCPTFSPPPGVTTSSGCFSMPTSYGPSHTHVLFSAAADFVVYLSAVYFFTRLFVRFCYRRRCKTTLAVVKYNYLITGVILSMFGKIGTLLMMIWDYEMTLYYTIDFFIMSSNVVAIKVFLGCKSWLPPLIITLLAIIIKWAFRFAICSLDESLPFTFAT